jgi:hypothetical protein
MSKTNSAVGASLPTPLCTIYLLVLLEDLWTDVGQASCLRPSVLRWGIGVSAAGEQEFLGVWRVGEGTESGWNAIADDLKSRGVEAIRVATGSDPIGIDAAIRVHYPRAVVLTERQIQFLQVTGDVLGHLPIRSRQWQIANACDAMRKVSLGLQRAWNRRGKPETSDSAAAFAARYVNNAGARAGWSSGDWRLGAYATHLRSDGATPPNVFLRLIPPR